MSPPPTSTAVWVLVPGTPLLLPHAAGASDPAAELRSTCVTALARGLAGAAGVTVLAAGTATRSWPAEAAYDLARLIGGDGPAAASIPLALAVGRHLVGAAGWDGPLALRTVAEPDETAPTGTVVAVGDGSLYRHSRGGPGPLDPRAAAYDESVRQAVATGDAAALGDLDPALGAELGVTGALPWRLLARAASDTPVDATLDFAGDPFGPYALIATWRFG